MYQNWYAIKNILLYLAKRGARIEPPYIISFLLIVLMRMLYCYTHNMEYAHNWHQFWLHFFYLNQYFGYESYTTVYWTLAIEFQFYILMGLIFTIILSNNSIYPVVLLVFFSALCWFLTLHYNWFIFQYGYLFITGIILFLYKIKHIAYKTFFILLVPVLILMYFKNGFEVALLAMLAGLAILKINRQWALPDFFGKISYSLYLVHLEAAGWFMLYLHPVIANDVILKLTGVSFAMLFATLFYYIFERPAFNLSKKVRYKANVKAPESQTAIQGEAALEMELKQIKTKV
jgi:peptidoglycan/LPS O-acetylase OafA/YrhL